MKKIIYLFSFVVVLFLTTASSCDNQESMDREIVAEQQAHYGTVQPIPYYDYSIPRDIVTQIYNVVTQEARNTYTVVESVTGVTKFRGPSVGYGIPADVSLTNPLQPAYHGSGSVIEQAEPNGLFSSKNTDGTWVLFVDVSTGDITPIYTEHKVTTFPFAVKKDKNSEWIRADKRPASMTIKFNGVSGVAK